MEQSSLDDFLAPHWCQLIGVAGAVELYLTALRASGPDRGSCRGRRRAPKGPGDDGKRSGAGTGRPTAGGVQLTATARVAMQADQPDLAAGGSVSDARITLSTTNYAGAGLLDCRLSRACLTMNSAASRVDIAVQPHLGHSTDGPSCFTRKL